MMTYIRVDANFMVSVDPLGVGPIPGLRIVVLVEANIGLWCCGHVVTVDDDLSARWQP